jgi:hypothetical protein
MTKENGINEYDFFFKKNLINNWKLYSTTEKRTLEYFNKYTNSIQIDELKDFYKDMVPESYLYYKNIEAIKFSNEIIYNNVLKINSNNIVTLRAILDTNNNIYDVFKINFIHFCNDFPLIIYWVNSNDPFFLVQSSWYTEFCYYGYLKDKILIEITQSTSGYDRIINILLENINSFY